MPHVPDLQSLLSAAEQAAAAGEHASAERLLREAAALQEAHLGPLHPDIARTLNNLAVACEMADNPVDAEHYFRRAYVTAKAVLDPDHPFVATSRRNLEEFCAARGKPVKLAAPAAVVVTAAGELPVGGAHETPWERPATNEPSQSLWPGWLTTRPVIAAALAAILLLTIAGATWFRSIDRTGSLGARAMLPDAHTTSQARLVPTTPADAPPEGVDTAPGEPADVEQPAAATAGHTDETEVRTAARSNPRAPVVAVARLCRTLSTRGREWQCVPAGRSIDPGPLFFYTRLKSSTAVRVQHRWYRGDRVHRVVDLSIGANTGSGYRTYSRSTVAPLSSGDWRIELRTTEGIVLHEERFVVR